MIKIICDIKLFREWKKQQRLLSMAIRPLYAIEIQKYSYEECLLAVSRSGRVPHEQTGIVAELLLSRSSRGKMTLEDAIKLYGK